MTQSELTAGLGAIGIVPVVVLDQAADAAPLRDALLAGGLPVAEVTLRTEAGIGSIAAMAAEPSMLVGAGTVLTAEQVDMAVEAGARFVVSPGFSQAVVARCREHGIPVFPGVATATEVQAAFEAGLTTVKFFPAEQSGGLPAIKALAAPFSMMRFMPTGGISAQTASTYLAHPAVHAVGGSWMVAKPLIAAGDFAEVTRLAGEAVQLARDVRGSELRLTS